MGWIIPEYKPEILIEKGLNPYVRQKIDSVIIHSQNVCIKGFAKTGKTLCLIYLIKRIKCVIPNISILFIVTRIIEVKKYRNLFSELGLNVDVTTYYKYLNNHRKQYKYIFCDDVQNISAGTLTTIADNAKRIVVTMNPYMPIFDKDLVSQEPTMSFGDVVEKLSPMVYELQCYHKGKLYKALISSLFPEEDIIFSNNSLSKIDYSFNLCVADDDESELDYIFNQAERISKSGYSVGILLPNNKSVLKFVQRAIKMRGGQPWEMIQNKWGRIDFSKLNQHLSKMNIPIVCIDNFSNNTEKPDSINLITYYNSMVFEFDTVFMPFLDDNIFIHSNENIVRNLFVYSLLSCRDTLYFTYCGNKHKYLEKIEIYCNKIDINNIGQKYVHRYII